MSISKKEREKNMILSMIQIGKMFKVYQVIEGEYRGKNRILLGTFKSSDEAIAFMERF
jgi:hypothetical protein